MGTRATLVGCHRAIFRPVANGLNILRASDAERLRPANFRQQDFRRELLLLRKSRVQSRRDGLFNLRSAEPVAGRRQPRKVAGAVFPEAFPVGRTASGVGRIVWAGGPPLASLGKPGHIVSP
jgi:hypothetical protein